MLVLLAPVLYVVLHTQGLYVTEAFLCNKTYYKNLSLCIVMCFLETELNS